MTNQPAEDAKMLAEALEFLLDPWSGRGYSSTKDKDAIANAKSAVAAYKSHARLAGQRSPVRVEEDGIKIDVPNMEEGRLYSVKLNGKTYAYRRVNEREVEVFAMTDQHSSGEQWEFDQDQNFYVKDGIEQTESDVLRALNNRPDLGTDWRDYDKAVAMWQDDLMRWRATLEERDAIQAALTQAQAERDGAREKLKKNWTNVVRRVKAETDERGIQPGSVLSSIVEDLEAQLATAQANCDALIAMMQQAQRATDAYMTWQAHEDKFRAHDDSFEGMDVMRDAEARTNSEMGLLRLALARAALRTPTTTPDSATPSAQEEA